MPCILPMAIIGRLKVSCRTGPAATTMTAAWTGCTRSAGGAGSISRTAEIGSVGMQNVPSSRDAARQERGLEKEVRPRQKRKQTARQLKKEVP